MTRDRHWDMFTVERPPLIKGPGAFMIPDPNRSTLVILTRTFGPSTSQPAARSEAQVDSRAAHQLTDTELIRSCRAGLTRTVDRMGKPPKAVAV